mmetsp:Transcript_23253/g.56581  ORF Transcript_23253/g.56581 Transcript_23253/m.56581 type:complete len:305 (+) Transcript_23253:66-980(+)
MVGWTSKVALLVGSCAWTGLSIDLISDVDDDVYSMDNPQELQDSLAEADMRAVADAVVTEKRQKQAKRLVSLRQRVNAGDKKAEAELQQQARLAAADEMKELAGLDDVDLGTPAPALSFANVKHSEVAVPTNGPDDFAHFPATAESAKVGDSMATNAVSFMSKIQSRRTQLVPDAPDASSAMDAPVSSDTEDGSAPEEPAAPDASEAPEAAEAPEAPAATEAPQAPEAPEAAQEAAGETLDEPVADDAPDAAAATVALLANPKPTANAPGPSSPPAAKASDEDSGPDVVADMARRLRGFGPTAE